MSGKVERIGDGARLVEAHAFIDQLSDQGYDTVVVCGIRRGGDDTDSIDSYWPSVFGPFKPSEVVFACQRMIWIEMAAADSGEDL